jgi:Ran GTPase-activating protein (RanGAP) involved in mRNA processing and transport
VAYNDLDDEGIRLLASSPLLPRLQRLDVGGNPFGAEALRGLLAALASTDIESLDLHDSELGDEPAAVLADAVPLR